MEHTDHIKSTNRFIGRFILFHTFHKFYNELNEQDLIILDLLKTADHNLLANNKEFTKVFEERYEVVSSKFAVNYNNGIK